LAAPFSRPLAKTEPLTPQESRSTMTFTAHIHSQLLHALELLEPILEAMRHQDRSELFLSIAPGVGEEIYRLLQQAAGRLLHGGWFTGRRGRVIHTLLKALASIQLGLDAPTADLALVHLDTASRILRRRRQELRLLQSDLAQALNVTPEAVGAWETGRRRMELGKVPRIAAILNLEPRGLCKLALHEFHARFYAGLFGNDPPGPARATDELAMQT
jgi:transcriptional regulator with XRE-family HTH domain